MSPDKPAKIAKLFKLPKRLSVLPPNTPKDNVFGIKKRNN